MADQLPSPTKDGPQLEVLNRVKNIPVVSSAMEKTGSTYSAVKGSHHLVNWACNKAEAGLSYASATAAPIAAPLAKAFEGQIHSVDQKLCQGLDIVEQTVPIVKQPPQEVSFDEEFGFLGNISESRGDSGIFVEGFFVELWGINKKGMYEKFCSSSGFRDIQENVGLGRWRQMWT